MNIPSELLGKKFEWAGRTLEIKTFVPSAHLKEKDFFLVEQVFPPVGSTGLKAVNWINIPAKDMVRVLQDSRVLQEPITPSVNLKRVILKKVIM